MIVDSHYHHDPSMVPLEALLASMDRCGVGRVALIPRFCPPLHLHPLLQQLTVPLFLNGIHRSSGVAYRAALALYRFNVKDDGTGDLLGHRYEIYAQPPNAEVAAVLAAHPDRFYGWTAVNPAGPNDPLAEIQAWMSAPGMIGVKAHPYWHRYPVSRLAPIADWCEKQGKPMLVHLGADERGDFRFLPETFPRLKIIYAHAGIPYSRKLADYAATQPGVYLDLACSGYVSLKAALRATAKAGAGKCLFGSDGPYFHDQGGNMDFGWYLDLIGRLGLNESDRQKVLGGNFQAVIGG